MLRMPLRPPREVTGAYEVGEVVLPQQARQKDNAPPALLPVLSNKCNTDSTPMRRRRVLFVML